MNKESLTLVKEYPDMISGEMPLRLYRTNEAGEDEPPSYRWHFGWPKEIFAGPVLTFIQTSVYWDNGYWCDDGDFTIWWIHLITENETLTEDEYKRLNRILNYKISALNSCISFLKRAAGK